MMATIHPHPSVPPAPAPAESASQLMAQLTDAEAAQRLAFFVLDADKQRGRVPQSAEFTAIASPNREGLRARAMVALRCDDPVVLAAQRERAALHLVADGLVTDLADARRIAASVARSLLDGLAGFHAAGLDR